MSDDRYVGGATSPNEHICGALQPHDLWPIELWFECGLLPGHRGCHEAFGSEPLERWARQEREVYAQEVEST